MRTRPNLLPLALRATVGLCLAAGAAGAQGAAPPPAPPVLTSAPAFMDPSAGQFGFDAFTTDRTFLPTTGEGLTVFDRGTGAARQRVGLLTTGASTVAPGALNFVTRLGASLGGLAGDPACSNGVWDGRPGTLGDRQGAPFAANASPGLYQRYTFRRPVAGFAALLSYLPACGNPGFGAPALRFIGTDGGLLAEWRLEDVAPIRVGLTTNRGEYRGLWRSAADIAAVEWGDGYAVLDDAVFTEAPASPPTSTVPEPATVLLIGVGLVALAARGARRGERPGGRSESRWGAHRIVAAASAPPGAADPFRVVPPTSR
jgi:hypothetical protein